MRKEIFVAAFAALSSSAVFAHAEQVSAGSPVTAKK